MHCEIFSERALLTTQDVDLVDVERQVLLSACQKIYAFPIYFFNVISGTADGQTKVVREGDNGVAYSWNMREQQWDKVILSFMQTHLFLHLYRKVVINFDFPKKEFLFMFLIQIGEVVDGPDDSMKRTALDGIQYDYGKIFFISFCPFF